MGFSIERNGMIDGYRVCHQLVTDMIAHGFSLVYPQDETGQPDATLITSQDTLFWVVDATTEVDPLADELPWRIFFEVRGSDPDITIHVATPLQIQVQDGSYEITDTYPTEQLIGGDSATNLTKYSIQRTLSGKLGRRDESHKTYDPKKYSFVQRGWQPTLTTTTSTSNTSDPTQMKGWTTALNSLIRKYIGSDPDTSWPTGTSFPFSYRLSISDHGVAFCVWYESQDVWGEMFSWFVVQRPVHPKTGQVLTNGKCPLFCMYCLQGGSPPAMNSINGQIDAHKYIYWYVVSEKDVLTQSIQRNAVKHSRYSTALVNPMNQVSFTENNEFIVNFPNNLSTDRYAYVHELDMIGYTSARVIAAWTMADIHMYDEKIADGITPFKRRYQGMMANKPINEGMRILMLVDGGGVDYAWPPINTSIGTKFVST